MRYLVTRYGPQTIYQRKRLMSKVSAAGGKIDGEKEKKMRATLPPSDPLGDP